MRIVPFDAGDDVTVLSRTIHNPLNDAGVRIRIRVDESGAVSVTSLSLYPGRVVAPGQELVFDLEIASTTAAMATLTAYLVTKREQES
jgi:hypothetical protein